jgi:hypothetical protein
LEGSNYVDSMSFTSWKTQREENYSVIVCDAE